jgi:sec-independent protein translocase protein TatA
MGFSGVGMSELLIILLIVVMIFGTKKLKDIGSDLGGAVKGFRKAMNDAESAKDDIKRIEKSDAEFPESATQKRESERNSSAWGRRLELMFEIGFWELVLLFVLGLIVLGPEKLPRVASQLGRYAGQARRMARVLTTQIRQEMEMEEQKAAIAKHAAPDPAPSPVYSRPGVEDLVPKQAEGAEPGVAASPQSPDHDQRPGAPWSGTRGGRNSIRQTST